MSTEIKAERIRARSKRKRRSLLRSRIVEQTAWIDKCMGGKSYTGENGVAIMAADLDVLAALEREYAKS